MLAFRCESAQSFDAVMHLGAAWSLMTFVSVYNFGHSLRPTSCRLTRFVQSESYCINPEAVAAINDRRNLASILVWFA
jgi:hypothetical protein